MLRRTIDADGGIDLSGFHTERTMPALIWKILTKKRNSATPGIPAGLEHLAWITNTVTLIHGERDAVLVDTFLSEQHSRELADWVAQSGKNLVAIYITHAHGDHYLGLKVVLDRFPNARAIATEPVAAAIREQIQPEFVKSFWESRFPGQLPSQFVAPDVITGDTFYLEGHPIKVVSLGHTDTSHSTALHVPSIGLVVAGDAVYNNTHLYLVESDERTRGEWLQALDRIESLNATAVVAGHGVMTPDNSPRHIAETRNYLRDFEWCVANSRTQKELFAEMLALHPGRVNPGSLFGAARAAKPS